MWAVPPSKEPCLLFANIIIPGNKYPLLLCLLPLAFLLEDSEPHGLWLWKGTWTPALEEGDELRGWGLCTPSVLLALPRGDALREGRSIFSAGAAPAVQRVALCCCKRTNVWRKAFHFHLWFLTARSLSSVRK